MSEIAKEAAELRFLVACLDVQVPGVTREDVARAVGTYASHAMTAGGVPRVLQQELSRWLERFGSKKTQHLEPAGPYESKSAPAYRAPFRRINDLRAQVKKEPTRRTELEEHLRAEETAVYSASRHADDPSRGTVDDEDELDDEDWADEDNMNDVDETKTYEPVPHELHLRRRGPTVSGGLPSLGRRRR